MNTSQKNSSTYSDFGTRTAKKPGVLIIDDDSNVLKLLSRFIQEAGLPSCSALTGEEGMAMARDPRVGLVLLDIRLKDSNGVALLEKLLRIRPDLAVIMITGFDDRQDAEKALELGAKDYITKPFDLEYLKTSVIANLILAYSGDNFPGGHVHNPF